MISTKSENRPHMPMSGRRVWQNPSVPAETHTNMRVLRRSRRNLRSGDIFAIGLPDASYVFGRVIDVNPPRETAPMPMSNLIYTYRQRQTDPTPDLSALTPDELLLPPIFTNRQAWSRGYFLNVAHEELLTKHLLVQHCFRDWTGQYRDRGGALLARETHPCGDWVLMSYRGYDDALSDALGIRRAPN